jgi:phosphoglycolate phosphatase
MKKIEAVIFDLDGTLLNTVEDIMDSVNSALQKYGFPPHSLEEYLFFIGDGIEELVKRALPENKRDDETFYKCLSLVKMEYKTRWHNKTKPYDGVKEMLFELSRARLKLAVFSNKPNDFTEITVKYYFPEMSFDVVLGAIEENPKKPDPWGALYISKRISVSPEKILYLGDTKTDIITAKKAGMISAGAAWGFRGRKELEKAGADYIIDFPFQFLQLAKSF